MSAPDSFAASLIRTSAGALAGFAASGLQEQYPETVAKFGRAGFSQWKESFTQRLDELAAAVEMGQSSLFQARIAWSRSAFETRDVPVEDLRRSLEVLREILSTEMPENASPTPCAFIEDALASLDAPLAETRRLVPDSRTNLLALAYLEALLSGDRRRAVGMIMEALGEIPEERMLLDVLTPAQTEIGHMWHAGEIGIAEEHFSTQTTQSVMALVSQQWTAAPPNGRCVVLASTEGNPHDMALRVLAAFFEQAGWRAIMVGADIPAPDLAEGAAMFEADLVVISATMATNLRGVRMAVDAIRQLRPTASVMVGGAAFEEATGLWKQVGADATAQDPHEAVRSAAVLVGLN